MTLKNWIWFKTIEPVRSFCVTVIDLWFRCTLALNGRRGNPEEQTRSLIILNQSITLRKYPPGILPAAQQPRRKVPRIRTNMNEYVAILCHTEPLWTRLGDLIWLASVTDVDTKRTIELSNPKECSKVSNNRCIPHGWSRLNEIKRVYSISFHYWRYDVGPPFWFLERTVYLCIHQDNTR